MSNGRELSRPIEKLYPLEIHSDEKEELTKQTSLNKEHEICLDSQTPACMSIKWVALMMSSTKYVSFGMSIGYLVLSCSGAFFSRPQQRNNFCSSM